MKLTKSQLKVQKKEMSRGMPSQGSRSGWVSGQGEGGCDGAF